MSALQERWDNLVVSAGSGIFLTYDWCRIWWKYYGIRRDLRVLVFERDAELVGIIPLFLETIWLGPVSVRVARLVGSDHTLAQFSLPIVSDHLDEILEKLAEHLLCEKWDILYIGPIAGLYEHYDALREAVGRAFDRTCSVMCRQKDVQTYYFVAETWEAQLAGLSKNARKQVRHSHRDLERIMEDEPGALFFDCATAQNVDEVFRGFVEMHQKLWVKKGRLGHFGDWPDSFDFHREMARAQLERGRLRLIRINWGQHTLACEYAYRLGNKYFALLGARTDRGDVAQVGLGNLMFTSLIKTAMAEKVKYIDDMESRYEYKMKLGGKLFPLNNIYVVRKPVLCRARVRLFRFFARVLHLCYCRIWYMRLAPRLPLRRRPFWRIWIRSQVLCH